MIDALNRLGPADLDRLARLERRVVAADGGRLKLEWPLLRSRADGGTNELVVRRARSMIGFAGIYAFGALEIAGAVHPHHRRQGVASELLAAAMAVCRERRAEHVLLVVPRTTGAGAAFARRHGGAFDHSEHALELTAAPAGTAAAPDGLELRPVQSADTPAVARLVAEAFGHPGLGEGTIPRNTTVVLRDGSVVGTVRVERDGTSAGVYGLAVDPAHQGQGIGRAVLRRVCGRLREQGVERIGLEVAVDNDRALALYTSVGFVPRVTEDYWSLPTGG
ncbi:GNAT family N-acetyltransferase [Jatrophihabitans endophyticus]|uniref:GNAT family N-acetyltransferase n=1 Tax=Jatrophihabitans endophyticus TaxID=1206085 RepID=UPI0019F27259|nr:GNAT family N-acetyltransferase [Jatrophihabitans endophyticus]MBE7187270.1 GNAT family N-acetyltransferase [Jatrophihabitans endophyticus]